MRTAAFTIYLGSLIFGVLFFGAIHTWVYTLVFLGVMAASLLMIKGEVVKPDILVPSSSPSAGSSPEEAPIREKVFVAPAANGGRARIGGTARKTRRYLRWVKTDVTPLFVLFSAFLILQMIPLPPGLLALISPDAKIAGDMSQPAGTFNPAASAESWYALAPYLYPVRMSLIRWVVYGLFFFGLIRCLDSRKRIETAVVAILLLCCFDALYGIMQTYSVNTRAWWFKLSGSRDLSGTYLNRNHFAGLMEMGIALVVGYAAALGGRGEEHQNHSLRGKPFKKRFLAFFSDRRPDIRRFLVVFAGGVMGLGLILSASRGGIIATAGALLLMGLCFYFRKSQRRKGRAILILFGIALTYGLYAGLEYTVERFEDFDKGLEDRLVISINTIPLLKDYLVTGVGVGNFRHAYGKYQPPQYARFYVDYAHNDYAQFLVEAGIAGSILLLAGVGWYVARTFRLWRQRNDPFALCLGIAPFGALAALAIHSLSDYNLHRPANMLVLIAVIAIGYTALHLERHSRHSPPQYRQRMIPLRPWGAILLAGAAGMILWSGTWTIRHFIAETYCNTDINITLNLKDNPSADEARAAIAWNPGNAVYPYKLARALADARDKRMQGPTPDREGWKLSHGPIIEALEAAILLNPLNADYHVRLAWEYSYLFDRSDYRGRWLPIADICLERAVWFAGEWAQNPRLQYDMGNYLTMRINALAPDDPKRGSDWAGAVWHYRKGMELEKRKMLPEDVRGYLANFFRNEAILYQPLLLYPSRAVQNQGLIFENLREKWTRS
jgi:O-antigen ligase